ncbi:MAG: FAD-dependent oxidoreductase [Pseudomonadota bacterium]
MRLSRPNTTAISPPVEFQFDGRTISALPGESIAAALAANGISAIRKSDVGGDSDDGWRGLYCGMGTCFDCLVTVDGKASQRACMTKVSGGETVRSAAPIGSSDDPLKALSESSSAELPVRACDILVVGAGAAGLSAALAARECGADVIVLDERAQPGGQYYKPVAPSHQVTAAMDRQFHDGQILARRTREAGVEIVQDASVWGAFRPSEVLALVDGTSFVFEPKRLILATGAFERAMPIPGWTLPGVMTTGAAQTLARAYNVSPGGRVVVAGNGPLNFQLAADLVSNGVEVAAVVESAPRPSLAKIRPLISALALSPRLMRDGIGYLNQLRRASVPVFWGHSVTAAFGTKALEKVQLSPVDKSGAPKAHNATSLDADTLCLGYGLIASTELALALGCDVERDPRHLGTPKIVRTATGETSVDGVFAVGDGAEVAGAKLAEADGTIAGYKAARQLGFDCQPSDGVRALRARKRAAQFQKSLWSIFEPPPVTLRHVPDDTVLCRCEGLTFGTIRRDISAGWTSPGTLKRRTRLGMGRCQARYCGPVAAQLLSEETGRPSMGPTPFASRLPVKPFPATSVAIEKPEWGGHARAGSPNLSLPEGAEPFEREAADIVIIGGGVVGACTAYYLADAGQDVLLVERDDINLQASGGNAGSLHVQLLSFDFGDKAEAGGGPAASTLPLGPWAIDLWHDLASISQHDFEIRQTGGLMVAEDEAGMAYLRAKADIERSHGIEAEILDAQALQNMAPNLSDHLIGAEYCPQEGKINPLVATYSVFNAARRAGTRYIKSADVAAISPTGSGFEISTSRGPIRAGKVINAAGPWARLVGDMVGISVPVYSAPLQMIVTERAPMLIDQLVAFADRHLTMKQLSTGGIVIGGAWTAAYDAERNLNVTTRASIEGNLWTARRVLPQIDGLHVLRSWAAMNVNIDGAPIVGEAPGIPGFYNTVTSNGYTLAPAVARITADLVLHGSADRDISTYHLDRFQ